MFKRILFLVFCLLSVGSCSAWTIDGDKVWQNDSNCYISVEPHTLGASGYSVVTFKSHNFTGNVDVCYGFDTDEAVPRSPSWKNHWENTTTNHQAYFHNVTNIVVYSGSNFDYGNDYNTYHRTITYHRLSGWDEVTNITTYELTTVNVGLDSYDQAGTNYTIYWHTDHSEWMDWTLIPSLRYHSITYDFLGFDKWYYATDLSVTAGVEYQTRIWLDIPVSLDGSSGKYFFAIKPSSETIAQAVANDHLYYIDPWWNASWDYKREIKINNTAGAALSHYQVFINLTDTPINATSLRVINENSDEIQPHWNETVVGGDVTRLWINISSIPAASWLNETIYIYYNNNNASSISNGEATFEFFDDFNTLNATKWTDNTAGGATIVNNSLQLSGNNLDNFYSVKNDWLNGILEMKIKKDTATGNGVYFGFRTSSVWLSSGYIVADWDGTGFNLYKASTLVETNSFSWTTDWYNIRIIVNGAAGGNGIVKGGISTGEITSYLIDYSDPSMASADRIKLTSYSGSVMHYDTLRVRKYASIEPTPIIGFEDASGQLKPPQNLQHTLYYFGVNYTWEADDTGNYTTDSYNVSVNGAWFNNSNQTWRNTTVPLCEWVNISVWAYNSTYNTLSYLSASDKQQVACDYTNELLYNELQDLKEENRMIDEAIKSVLGIFLPLFILMVLCMFYSFIRIDLENYTHIFTGFIGGMLGLLLGFEAFTLDTGAAFNSGWAGGFLCLLGGIMILYTILQIINVVVGETEELQ